MPRPAPLRPSTSRRDPVGGEPSRAGQRGPSSARRVDALGLALGLLVAAAPDRAAAEEPPIEPAVPAAPADAAPAADAADEVADAAPPADAEPDDADATADEGSKAPAEGPEEGDAPTPAPPATEKKAPARTPPRVDGIYLGAIPYVPITFARVRVLDTPGAFVGAGGAARIGEAVYPWLTLGLDVGGSVAYHGNQRVAQGALFVDAGFLPVPRIPFSIHVGFGVGGGAVRQQGIADRQGFGGAAFRGGLRYDVFPLVVKRQRKRGGGFAFGPELGWIGFTPAAKGRPMSNTAYLGLFVGYYFGS